MAVGTIRWATAATLLVGLYYGHARADDVPVGRWVGTNAADEKLDVEPLELAFTKVGNAVTGSITFPRQGLRDWPFDELEIDAEGIRARYKGWWGDRTELDLSRDGERLTGTIRYPEVTTTCRFARDEAADELPYDVEKFTLASGEVRLAATLYLPHESATRSGIVLVEGSGETTPPYQRFYADYFARHGITCLFYDKRGCGDSTGNWLNVGFEELADDVAAAAEYLVTRPTIDPHRVGAWGISQAGWIIPMAAARTDKLSYLIVVSGGAVTVEREGYWDVEYWFPRQGLSQTDVREAIEFLKFNNHVTRTGEDYEELVERYKALKGKKWVKHLVVTPPQLNPANSGWRAWYRRVMDIDHVPYVAALTMPVFWIYGDNDDTFPAMEAAAKVQEIGAEHNRDFTVHILHGTGHGMHGPSPEGALPFRQFNPQYFERMESWLVEQGILAAP